MASIEVQAPVEPPKILRQTTSYTAALLSSQYDNLKARFPTVVGSIEQKVGSLEWLPAALETTQNVANPLLDRLDDQIDPIVKKVEENGKPYIEYAQQRKDQVIETVTNTKEQLQQRKDQVIETVSKTKEQLVDTYNSKSEHIAVAVSHSKEQLVDSVNQKKALVLDTVNQVTASTRQRWEGASNATSKRIESSLQNLKTFTSEQSVAFLHVDLVEYSKQFLDDRKPALDSLVKRFDETLETMKPMQEKIKTNLQSGREKVMAVSAEQLQRAKNVRDTLKQRLASAIVRARALRASSSSIPSFSQVFHLISNSPELIAAIATDLEAKREERAEQKEGVSSEGGEKMFTLAQLEESKVVLRMAVDSFVRVVQTALVTEPEQEAAVQPVEAAVQPEQPVEAVAEAAVQTVEVEEAAVEVEEAAEQPQEAAEQAAE